MDWRELLILQHAVGADQYGRSSHYRNHFCTGVGSKDHAACEALVDQGFMVARRNVAMYAGDDVFFVTPAGRKAMEEASPTPPRLTRSQRRYQDYLDADSGWSFGEWLKSGYAT